MNIETQLLDGHKACKTTLSLTQYQRERLIGVASILYLRLKNCNTDTMIKTSIYDVDTKCAAGDDNIKSKFVSVIIPPRKWSSMYNQF